MGPANLRVAWGVKYAASGGMVLLLLLGLLANLTVMGSVDPLGMVPFNSWMARSASRRWSKRMKPTPFDRPTGTTRIVLSLRRAPGLGQGPARPDETETGPRHRILSHMQSFVQGAGNDMIYDKMTTRKYLFNYISRTIQYNINWF